LEKFRQLFAFQEGMWDTQSSALLSSPTVSARYWYTSPRVRLPQPQLSRNSIHLQRVDNPCLREVVGQHTMCSEVVHSFGDRTGIADNQEWQGCHPFLPPFGN